MPTPDAGKTARVLFLCTGNSARSILAEALLRSLGRGRFEAASAGSHPKGSIHPLALELLARKGLASSGMRSKSWDEFAGPGTAPFDVVVTVCDAAAGETCPVAAARSRLHWSVADPAAAEGDEATQLRAFEAARAELERRIRAFIADWPAAGPPDTPAA